MVSREIASRVPAAEPRCRIIPNGVDLERFRPGRRAEARNALGVAPDVPVWLFVGHGFRRKGLETALRAVHSSRASSGELWVAGGDPPAAWERLASEIGVSAQVRFLGPRRDVERLYAAADALILPTRYDAFANVTLEAAASGCVPVTTPQNGAAEWFGDACATVSATDVEGFAEWLDRLAEPAERDRLATAARRRAEDASWSRHIDALRRLYRERAPEREPQ